MDDFPSTSTLISLDTALLTVLEVREHKKKGKEVVLGVTSSDSSSCRAATITVDAEVRVAVGDRVYIHIVSNRMEVVYLHGASCTAADEGHPASSEPPKEGSKGVFQIDGVPIEYTTVKTGSTAR